jgi:type 1 glutamine amidotransferase
LALALLAGPPPAAAQSARVLYLTQSAAFAHPVLPHSEAVFTRIAKESGQLDVTVSRDASILNADSLAGYDAVVFFTTGELPLDDAQKAALLAWVRGGGAFVGVHSATDTFYEWPGYLALIGGYFDGHPWHQEVTVRVEDPEHPATRHLGESFRIHDEIYQHREWSRDNVDVLLSLDTGSVDMNARNIRRADRDFALAWTREEGAGRVFYTALGHRPEVWDDPRFQTHLLQGIAWAIGSPAGADDPAANTLTAGERADGWKLLFDGENLAAWRGYKRDGVPDGWQPVDGALARVGRGGDLVTVEQFADFELRFDWKVEQGGNSGVMFRVAEGDGPPWHTGPEFQILHNAGHRDGQAPITSAGSNYAVHPPAADVTRPVGEWNTSRLIVDRGRVEHWMNGMHLLTYRLGDADWQARVEASKFAPLPRYGRVTPGHIAIQDHGDPVRFRNILIREID